VRTVAERRREALGRQAEQEASAVVVEDLGVLREEGPRDATDVEDPLQHVGPVAPDHLRVDATARSWPRTLCLLGRSWLRWRLLRGCALGRRTLLRRLTLLRSALLGGLSRVGLLGGSLIGVVATGRLGGVSWLRARILGGAGRARVLPTRLRSLSVLVATGRRPDAGLRRLLLAVTLHAADRTSIVLCRARARVRRRGGIGVLGRGVFRRRSRALAGGCAGGDRCGNAATHVEAAFEPVEACGVALLPRSRGQEQTGTEQFELEAGRGGAGHLGEARVDDVGGVGELARPEGSGLLAHAHDLVFGDAAQDCRGRGFGVG